MRKFEIEFPLSNLAAALGLTPGQTVEIYKDARACSPILERRHANDLNLIFKGSNNPYVDLVNEQGLRYSLKCLGKSGVKFQASRYVGSGRKCSVDDLIASLTEADIFVISDITNFPKISVIEINSSDLIKAVNNGRLGTGGWSGKQFRSNIDEILG